MANDKKNINELVTDDDDPTAELEALVLHAPYADFELESEAHTSGFADGDETGADDGPDFTQLQSDQALRTDNIDRLQFDLAQLQAKCLGLEAEIESRNLIRTDLHAELSTTKSSLKRKQGLLRKRDQQIKALREEIRERNENYLQLQEHSQNQANRLEMRGSEAVPFADPAASINEGGRGEFTIREMAQRYSSLEEYADQLRQQLQDSRAEAGDDRKTLEFLQSSLLQANDRATALEHTSAEIAAQNAQLTDELAALRAAHVEEIRTLRFELGSAQETVTQHEMLTEQLASDLVETRTYRVELENMLSATEDRNRSRIEKLEKENSSLRRQATDFQQKLETKNEAINCLINELAKKSQQIEPSGGLEEVIRDVDDMVAERNDTQGQGERDRVTRVLIGSVDNQELRFPLFKDRLTIGRTAQNDIQLKASHISRRHAVIVTEGSATRIVDWGSKNGVYVNSTRVTEHFLKHGDVVSIGTAEFRYEERAKRES